MKILETWVIADRIDEARALLDRLASDQKLDAPAYVDFGLMMIMRITPPPAPLGMFPFLNAAPPPPPRPPTRPGRSWPASCSIGPWRCGPTMRHCGWRSPAR